VQYKDDGQCNSPLLSIKPKSCSDVKSGSPHGVIKREFALEDEALADLREELEVSHA
jgi:hypothetical protein